MAEATLRCALLADGRTISVKIALSSKVSELREAIFDIMRSDEPHLFAPSDISLFVPRVRMDEAWLTDDNKLRELRRVAEAEGGLVEMEPSSTLDDDAYFGKTNGLKENEVHVVVKLTDSARRSKRRRLDPPVPSTATEATTRREVLVAREQLMERLRHQETRPKPKRYGISELDEDDGVELLAQLYACVDDIELEDSPTSTPVDPFRWDRTRGDEERGDTIDESVRTRYQAYLHDHLGDVLTNLQLCVVASDPDDDSLSTRVRGHDVRLCGSTDLLVMSTFGATLPPDSLRFQETKMLVEVQQAVAPRFHYRTALKLVAFDLLACDAPVMALLTNLTDAWSFYWVGGKRHGAIRIKLLKVETPAQAFAVTKAWLTRSPKAAFDMEKRRWRVAMPGLQRPIQVGKLENHLPLDDGPTNRESFQQYLEVAREFGPDVALARAVAQRLVRSMPGCPDDL